MDDLPTLWEAEPHTVAKHGILSAYLGAWVAILGRGVGPELLFVDGFAGPGEYANGVVGSPLVALKVISEHSAALCAKVRLFLVEARPDRHAHLTTVLRKQLDENSSPRVLVDGPHLGDCNQLLTQFIESRIRVGQPVGPGLFFLDQFGFSQVPMSLIRAVMANPQCEVFSYLNFCRMNQFMGDESKHPGLTDAFGDDSWRGALELRGKKREVFLLQAYCDAIRRHAPVTFVWPFAMFDSMGRLIHWLIFSTNSAKGLYEMKRAMWRADNSGQYRYSDREDPKQETFLNDFKDEWLAAELATKFKGQTLSLHEVAQFVLSRTPFYLHKPSLKLMECRGEIELEKCPPGRRKGSFPDDSGMQIRFL